MAQESEIVAALRKALRHAVAQRAQGFEIVTAHDLGMTLAQPRQQMALGGRDHRTHRPQGVVQIETQDERGDHGAIVAQSGMRLRVNSPDWGYNCRYAG